MVGNINNKGPWTDALVRVYWLFATAFISIQLFVFVATWLLVGQFPNAFALFMVLAGALPVLGLGLLFTYLSKKG